MIILELLILFNSFISFSQERLELPVDFKENAFKHVQDLVSFGNRNAGTKSENLTMNYLIDFYNDLNLIPKIDTFYFEYFNAESIDLRVNDQKIAYKTIGIHFVVPELMAMQAEFR